MLLVVIVEYVATAVVNLRPLATNHQLAVAMDLLAGGRLLLAYTFAYSLEAGSAPLVVELSSMLVVASGLGPFNFLRIYL